MIIRKIAPILKKAAQEMPVVALLGPRQSGKTTLAKATFPEYAYISLEDFDQRSFATSDPRGFLDTHMNDYGIILDEFQNVPTILSYIQTYVDTYQEHGKFILTGSQNFLLSQAISQTLAGRIALLNLQPLSITELSNAFLLPENVNSLILQGQYPRIYAHNLSATTWYRDYISTYLERDVRTLKNVGDLGLFHRFLQLCAGRIGQLVNASSLASDCGIDVRTARSWISMLEASYIIMPLQPYYKNFSKSIIKTPKLFFNDTGLACSLLGIETEQQLSTHYLRGGLFESLIITDLIKRFYNSNRRPPLYFWRDKGGHEVDCIIEQGNKLIPIEIKAGMTIADDFFSGLSKWQEITNHQFDPGYILYAGKELQRRSNGTVLPWYQIEKIGLDM